MIIDYIIDIIFGTFNSIFTYILVPVSLTSIPFIGSTISGILLSVVSTYNAVIVTFPYAQVGFQVFLYVILPFELLMTVGKLLLGHRMPSHAIN